jgi:hypothetical protein
LGSGITKKQRLRVFENRALRKIGSKRDKIIGECRKLYNEELHKLHSSPGIIKTFKARKMRLAGQVARMAAKRNAYSILVGKPEGKRRLGRSKQWWENNIKLDLTEIE